MKNPTCELLTGRVFDWKTDNLRAGNPSRVSVPTTIANLSMLKNVGKY